MQNKTFKILLITSVTLAIVFAFILINDARKNKIANNPQNNGLEDPFGSGTEVDLPFDAEEEENSPNTDNQGQNNGLPGNPSGNIVIVEENPILSQITSEPVAGFTFVKEERVIEEDLTTPSEGIVEVYDFSGYKTFRFADKSPEIIKIKTVLNRQTPSPALVLNEEYDTDMKNAVVDFQNKNGLSGDGVIGSKTYKALNKFQGIETFTNSSTKPKTEFVEMVRYVESAGGLMFDKAIKKKEEKVQISKNSIPRVVEAFFDSTGTKVVLRYLKDDLIQTYLVSLAFPKVDFSLSKEEREKIPKVADVSGEFLPENIDSLDVSYDGKNLFYFNPVTNGVSGIAYNFATKSKKEVWRTPFTEWIVDFASESKINITTKASEKAPGFSYTLDSKTSSFSRNLGNINGLTTLMSPDGKKVLYAEAQDGGISTYILDLTTQKVSSISPSAIPEKCIWTKDSMKIYCASSVKSPKFVYPDDWYKGKVSFDDALWVIDLSDMSGNIIYDIVSKAGKRLDIVSMKLNSEENYLVFINKKDGTLFGFDLTR